MENGGGGDSLKRGRDGVTTFGADISAGPVRNEGHSDGASLRLIILVISAILIGLPGRYANATGIPKHYYYTGYTPYAITHFSTPQEACKTGEFSWPLVTGRKYYNFDHVVYVSSENRYECWLSAGPGDDFFRGYINPTIGCPQGYSPSGGVCLHSGADPGKNEGWPRTCPVGDPVNQATGNQIEEVADYREERSLGLTFRRYRNSDSFETTDLGSLWRDNFDRSVELMQPTGTLATVYRPDGHRLFFVRTNGVWTPDADVHGSLEQLFDGSGNAIGWRYITKTDIAERYDAQGRLLSISDLSGRTQTLRYDANGLLHTVTDQFGRQLVFTYLSGRLASVTTPNGERYQYRYDARDNLASVTYPDGTTETYHYESARTHALTGITDRRGIRFATIEYDDQGRASATYHGPQTDVLTDRIDGISIAYNADRTRTVTDSRGNQTTYGVTTQLGVVLPSQVTGPACGCGGP